MFSAIITAVSSSAPVYSMTCSATSKIDFSIVCLAVAACSAKALIASALSAASWAILCFSKAWSLSLSSSAFFFANFLAVYCLLAAATFASYLTLS